VTLPAAGTYNLAVTDFQFPAGLILSSTIAQNGVVLPQTSIGDFSAAKGIAIVVVNAQPPQTGGTGIFDVTVQTSGTSPQILLDQTQAVGGVFDTRTITVGASGAYDATLTDLDFPVAFQNLAVVVSHGGQIDGKIFGGGTFTLSVTPRQYVLTFAATPNSQQNYGLYVVRVTSSAPLVTFPTPATVTVGQPVQLTWSSQNATACTASGATGWSGTEPTSGTLAVSLGATATLTLTCTGPGGSAAKSVIATVTPAPAKSGGGGGSLDLGLLGVLGGWVLTRRRLRRAAARVMQR
jgi:hypothetical protein